MHNFYTIPTCKSKKEIKSEISWRPRNNGHLTNTTRRSTVTQTITIEASIRHSSMSAPQAVCYPSKSLLIQQSNSGGPVTKLKKFTFQPENTL